MGLDPGFRTGVKVAVVDATGKLVATDTIYPHEPRNDWNGALATLAALCIKYRVELVSVGNGTASRETDRLVQDLTAKMPNLKITKVVVSEAGASVYSASELAANEFPDLDVSLRGAVSIARRLQDPLAELVKIDPKSIGVGQYQHDVAQHLLKRSLDDVVDGCVNLVGVNLNTASEPLLARVSGIGPALAQAVVARRTSKGLFRSRQELLEVPRFSKKAFEQAAGFLRVPEAANPLDNTAVHPERYAALEALAGRLGKPLGELVGAGAAPVREDAALKEEVGALTHADIVSELEKPGRDPRPAFTLFQYREDIRELKDLKPGMVCPGIVTNVTSFGAFVDVGVHNDGLVHVSQIADKPVKDPGSLLHPGQRVSVRVLEVNLEKKQIALTMKTPRERPRPRPRPAPKRPEPRRAVAPRPAAAAPLPPRAEAPRPAPPRPAPKPQPRPAPARPAPRPSFNNPFAVLADLKKNLKDKR
jgi:uncharacterized protein